jgi:hypothetical protein
MTALFIPAPLACAILAGVIIATAALDSGIRILDGMIVQLRAAA